MILIPENTKISSIREKKKLKKSEFSCLVRFRMRKGKNNINRLGNLVQKNALQFLS